MAGPFKYIEGGPGRVLKIEGADLLAPLVDRATGAALSAEEDAAHVDAVAAAFDAHALTVSAAFDANAASRTTTFNANAVAKTDALANAGASAAVIAAATGVSISLLTRDAYPNTAATNVPQGAVSTNATPGTGGTNATDVVATWTGGTLTYNPYVLYDIVGGVQTNVRTLFRGLYIGTGTPIMPTISNTGRGTNGLTLTAGRLFQNGQTYFALSSNGQQYDPYQIVANAPQPMTTMQALPTTNGIAALIANGIADNELMKSMPANLTGLYMIDDYTKTGTQGAAVGFIRNRAAPSYTPPKGLFNGTRRAYATARGFWGVQNCTTADEAGAIMSDGKMTSALISATAANGYIIRQITGLPAGTYTFAGNVQRGGTADEAISLEGGTGAATAFTAGAATTRIARTFTHAGGNLQLLIRVASATAKVLVDCFNVYAGSVDPGPDLDVFGHMFFGKDLYTQAPAYANGVLDFTASSGRMGTLQLEAPMDMSLGFTVVSMARKTATGNGFAALLAGLNTATGAANYTQFCAALDYDAAATPKPGFQFGGTPNFQGQIPSGWDHLNAGARTFAHRYDPTTKERSLWVNGGQLFSDKTAPSSVTVPSVRDMLIGSIMADLTYGGSWQLMGGVAIFNRALTDAEIVSVQNTLAARALAKAVVAVAAMRVLCIEGDSLTESNCYPVFFGPNQIPKNIAAIYAVSGSALPDVMARMTKIRKMRPANPPAGSVFKCSIFITNGVGGDRGAPATPTDWLAYIYGMAQTLRAEGWKVLLATPTDRNNAAYRTNKNIINPDLRSNAGAKFDAIIDFASDSTIGADGAAGVVGGANSTNFPDGVHPTATIQQNNYEPIYRAAVNAV